MSSQHFPSAFCDPVHGSIRSLEQILVPLVPQLEHVNSSQSLRDEIWPEQRYERFRHSVRRVADGE